MSEWKECNLGEVSLKIGSGATPRGGGDSYKESGISLIRSQNILDFKFSMNGLAYIDDEQADGLKNVTVEENDVLLNITGDSVARCCIVPNKILPARVNQHVSIIRPDLNKADYRFIFYTLQLMKEELLQQSEIGATRNALTKGMIENLDISLPPLEEQKTIAEVLSSLDDKIDLLHRQNKTLEKLAQTLFRQWFVEEAGDDWEEVTLGDVLEIKYGKDHKLLSDGNIPVYGSGGIMRYANKFLYDKESILIPRKGTLTNIFYIDEPFWTVDTIFWSKINREKASVKFLFSFLKTMDLSILNVGSAVPSLTTKVLNEIKISLPSIDEQKKFNEYADNAWNKIKSNNIQIKTLENMRDALLPQLMSGEVRVKL